MRWSLLAVAGLAAALAVSPSPAGAQVPTDTGTARPAITHVLRTRDGSTLLGRLVSDSGDTIRFQTSGGVLSIPRQAVLELRPVEAKALRHGEYWFSDPNRTRLFFAPTGRTLDRGEGYYSNTYLFLQNFAGGVTDHVTMGGGFSIFPTESIEAQVYYLTPKVNVLSTEKTNLAVGALAAWVPYDDGQSFGILYGVGTQGGPDGSVTGGIGWGYTGDRISKEPVLLLGGAKRVSRRVALVSENYGMWYDPDPDYVCTPGGCADQPVSRQLGVLAMYGVRFMGEKLSVDFALWNVHSHDTEWLFPGIPYVAFAVKF